jgi:DHA2 family multidrug resistance protein
VRAEGQSIFMVPLMTITTGLIDAEQAGSASGLFNMLRNLGGSVGIAVLSTLVSMREQFHSAEIGEGVSQFSVATQQRLYTYTQLFIDKGFDSVTANQKAIGLLDATVRTQANVMAFNDCFLFVASALVLSSILILFCRKVGRGPSAAGAH